MQKSGFSERARGLSVRFRRSYPGRCLQRALDIAITDRMMALAAQAFLAILPLFLVVASIAPAGVKKGLVDGAHKRFGLRGSAEQNVQQLTSSTHHNGVTAIGFLIVLFSATSFSRALQRVYEHSWGLEPGGLRSAWRPVAWILGLVAYLVFIGFAITLTHSGGPLTVVRLVVTFVGSLMLWWWTPFVLLSGRVTWRALLPSALLSSTGTVILTFVSAVYVPRAMASNEEKYGTIGVAFTLESWLVVLAAVMVATAVMGAVTASLTGLPGRIARGTADPDGWRRTRRWRQETETSA